MDSKMESDQTQSDHPPTYTLIKSCRICKSKDLKPFLKFGEMPLAGGFIKKEDLSKEKLYPLTVAFCQQCKETQVLETVSPEILFNDYRYVSSTTTTLSNHFKHYAKTMHERFLDEKSLVVEFGSNDGVLLEPFGEIGVKAIGVEPAKNIAKLARQKNCEVINSFFNSNTAQDIKDKHGEASLICANNVFAHIDDIHEPLRGIKLLLKEDGVFVFEVHYLGKVIEEMQYDMIYHEHLYYYSLLSAIEHFRRYNMVVFDLKLVPIHAGSLRLYVSKECSKHALKISDAVQLLAEKERAKGYDKFWSFQKFSNEVATTKTKLIKVLKKIKSEGKTIAGYGSSGRANTMIQYCEITEDLVSYMIDDAPAKTGFFTPGSHLEIFPSSILSGNDAPDYVLVFAWSFFDEILKRNKNYIKAGGRMILPLPQVKIYPEAE